MVRGLLTVVLALGLVHWLAGVAGSTARLVSRGAPVRADELLVGLAAGASALCLLWLAVAVGLGLGALLPGVVGEAAHVAGAALTPRLMQRVVGLAFGVGVVAGLAPGARWPRRRCRPPLSPSRARCLPPGSRRCRTPGGEPPDRQWRMPVRRRMPDPWMPVRRRPVPPGAGTPGLGPSGVGSPDAPPRDAPAPDAPLPIRHPGCGVGRSSG